MRFSSNGAATVLACLAAVGMAQSDDYYDATPTDVYAFEPTPTGNIVESISENLADATPRLISAASMLGTTLNAAEISSAAAEVTSAYEGFSDVLTITNTPSQLAAASSLQAQAGNKILNDALNELKSGAAGSALGKPSAAMGWCGVVVVGIFGAAVLL